ncbi:hypothetical protein Tco_0214390 [Tanacetum coccineum]
MSLASIESKLDLDSSYLWHVDLPILARSHAKLQHEGLLESINEESFDTMRSWIMAFESAVRILIWFTKKVDKTPYEIWHGKVPNMSYLKVWGCEAYVKRDSADKLKQRSVKCMRFSEEDLISQEFSGRDCDLEDDHIDTLPSENTSEIPVEPESLGPPPELIPVRRLGNMGNYGLIAASRQEYKRFGEEIKRIYHVCCKVHKGPDVAILLKTWSVGYQQNPGEGSTGLLFKHILKLSEESRKICFSIWAGNPYNRIDVTGDVSWQCAKDVKVSDGLCLCCSMEEHVDGDRANEQGLPLRCISRHISEYMVRQDKKLTMEASLD